MFCVFTIPQHSKLNGESFVDQSEKLEKSTSYFSVLKQFGPSYSCAYFSHLWGRGSVYEREVSKTKKVFFLWHFLVNVIPM